MLDFENLGKYTENEYIEAKSALGGLPQSLWETYSAFANADGGYILLGVKEGIERALYPVELPDPESLIEEFWYNVKNPNRVSVNILSEKDVYVQSAMGKHIVVINVPKASRADRPVYIDNNPLNTYRRIGDEDILCEKDEVFAMIREAFDTSENKR